LLLFSQNNPDPLAGFDCLDLNQFPDTVNDFTAFTDDPAHIRRIHRNREEMSTALINGFGNQRCFGFIN
jgi:hypothetical protein